MLMTAKEYQERIQKPESSSEFILDAIHDLIMKVIRNSDHPKTLLEVDLNLDSYSTSVIESVVEVLKQKGFKVTQLNKNIKASFYTIPGTVTNLTDMSTFRWYLSANKSCIFKKTFDGGRKGMDTFYMVYYDGSTVNHCSSTMPSGLFPATPYKFDFNKE